MAPKAPSYLRLFLVYEGNCSFCYSLDALSIQFQVDFHFFFIKFSFLIFLIIRTKKFSETTRSVSLVKADKNETVDTEKV